MFKDFKKFILRGNVVDLAVAVVIGAAFNSVVTGLVKDFITPLIQGATGNSSGKAVQGVYHLDVFSKHFLFPWGDFVSTVISFVIIAAVVFFFVVQPINKLLAISNRNKTTPEPTTKKCPECFSEVPKQATRCAFCQIKLKAEKA
jgi:large conductance mechanosensitive channel